MLSSIRNTFIGISLSVAATSAAALPITFDFSGHRSLNTSHTFTESGLAVKAKAHGGGRLVQRSSGLGVGGSHWFDTNQLDGSIRKESISFNFSTAVRLLDFTLSRVGYGDEATLTVDDLPTVSYNPSGNKVFGNNTVTIGTNFTGTDFLFGVTDWDDSYFISGLAVEATEVPEPGTIALFAVGLVGLGLARKRARV